MFNVTIVVAVGKLFYNYEVWYWGVGGKASFVSEFETEEEAEDYIFQKTYEYDFQKDDQRDTVFWESYDEAMQELIARIADSLNVDYSVAESIMRRKAMLADLRIKKEAARIAAEAERVNKIAEIYADMISKYENESYKDTAARLSLAIGKRIESKVFHTAVKMIRK